MLSLGISCKLSRKVKITQIIMQVPTISSLSLSSQSIAAFVPTLSPEVTFHPYPQKNNFEVDELFYNLVQNGLITTDCSWTKDMSFEPIIDNNEERSQICLNLLSKIQHIHSKDKTFTIEISYLEIIFYLRILDFHIVGSTVLSELFGKNCTEKAFAKQGICNFLTLMPKENIDQVFTSNDIDFRCHATHYPPEYYTKNIIDLLIQKLPQQYAKLSLQERKQIILENFITDFFKSPADSPSSYAAISFGACDFFFWSKKLDRKYLYHNDALRGHCKIKNQQFELTFEGDFNGGWDTVLLQLMGILRTDKVDELNLQGMLSLLRYYTKGKRLVSADLEKQFHQRFLLLIQATPSNIFVAQMIKSTLNHFPNHPGAALVFSLNLMFFLDGSLVETKMQNSIREFLLSKKLLKPGDDLPELQLLNSIIETSIANATRHDKKFFLPLCAFLQLFSYLHSGGQFRIFSRLYAKKPSYCLCISTEIHPLYFVVQENANAINRVKEYYHLEKDQTALDLLHRLYHYFHAVRRDSNLLFLINEIPSLTDQQNTCEDAEEMLDFDSPLFQQLAFSLICQKGILIKTAIHLPRLITRLPFLLAKEKSPQLRQALLYHFIQYALRTLAKDCFLAYSDQIEKFYVQLANQSITPAEILLEFSLTFAAINRIDVASTACSAWKESCLLNFTPNCSAAGKKLIAILPQDFTIEFFKALKEILMKTQDTYVKISSLFFECCENEKSSPEELALLKASGELLLKKIKFEKELSGDDKKRLILFTQKLLIHSQNDGWDFLNLLTNKKLIPEIFQKIINEKSKESFYNTHAHAKAELILNWFDRSSSEQSANSLSIKGLHERIELLIDGCTPPLSNEFSERFALNLMQLLLIYDEKNFSPPPRVKEKLKTKVKWIYANACSGLLKENNRPLPLSRCLLLKSLHRWDLCSFLDQTHLDQFTIDLECLLSEKNNSELLHALICIFAKDSDPLTFYIKAAGIFVTEKNFDRAISYLEKVSLLIDIIDFPLAEIILQCSADLLRRNASEKSYSLLFSFLTKQFPVSLDGFNEHCNDILLALGKKDPIICIQFLLDFHIVLSTKNNFSPFLESFILDILGNKPPPSSLPYPPTNLHKLKKNKSHQAKPQLPLKKTFSLLQLYAISSQTVWKEIAKASSEIYENEEIKIFFTHFESLSKTVEWCNFPDETASCWRELILATRPQLRIHIAPILIRNEFLIQLLVDSQDYLPKQKQEFFEILLIAFLNLAKITIEESSKKETINATCDLEARMKKMNLIVTKPHLLLDWIKALRSFSDFKSILKLWTHGNQLLLLYSQKSEILKINELHELLWGSTLQICSLQGKELTQICTLLIKFADKLFSLKNHSLLTHYFFLFARLNSDQAMNKAMQLVSCILTMDQCPVGINSTTDEWGSAFNLLLLRLSLRSQSEKYYELLMLIEKSKLMPETLVSHWYAIELEKTLLAALSQKKGLDLTLSTSLVLKFYEKQLHKIVSAKETTFRCHRLVAQLLPCFENSIFDQWSSIIQSLVNLENIEFRRQWIKSLESVTKEWELYKSNHPHHPTFLSMSDQVFTQMSLSATKVAETGILHGSPNSIKKLKSKNQSIEGQHLFEFICALLDQINMYTPTNQPESYAIIALVYFHLNILLTQFPDRLETIDKLANTAKNFALPSPYYINLPLCLFQKFDKKRLQIPQKDYFKANLLLQATPIIYGSRETAIWMTEIIDELCSQKKTKSLYQALSILHIYQIQFLLKQYGLLLKNYSQIAKSILDCIDTTTEYDENIGNQEQDASATLWETLWVCIDAIENEQTKLALFSSVISAASKHKNSRGPRGLLSFFEKISALQPNHTLRILIYLSLWTKCLNESDLELCKPFFRRLISLCLKKDRKQFSGLHAYFKKNSSNKAIEEKNRAEFFFEEIDLIIAMNSSQCEICYHLLIEKFDSCFLIPDPSNLNMKIGLLKKLMPLVLKLDSHAKKDFFLRFTSIYFSDNTSGMRLLMAIREWVDLLKQKGLHEDANDIAYSSELRHLFFNTSRLVYPFLNCYINTLYTNLKEFFLPLNPLELQAPKLIASCALDYFDQSQQKCSTETIPKWQLIGKFLIYEKNITAAEAVKSMINLFHNYFYIITLVTLPEAKRTKNLWQSELRLPLTFGAGTTLTILFPQAFFTSVGLIHDLLQLKNINTNVFLLNLLREVQELPYMQDKIIEVLSIYEILMPMVISEDEAQKSLFLIHLYTFFTLHQRRTYLSADGKEESSSAYFLKILNLFNSLNEKHNNTAELKTQKFTEEVLNDLDQL